MHITKVRVLNTNIKKEHFDYEMFLFYVTSYKLVII